MNTAIINLIRAAKQSVALILLLMLWLPHSAQARPCACCIVPGTWYERSEPVYDYQWEIINNLKLYRAAKLNLRADPSELKGIAVGGDAAAEDFRVSLARNGRRWTMTFRTTDGKTGALALTLPKTATQFGVDLESTAQKVGNAQGKLYKEVRFKGPVSGTGIFQKSNGAGVRFLLVLNGYGNNCMAGEDFKNWHLIVSGPRVSYSFLGSFVAP